MVASKFGMAHSVFLTILILGLVIVIAILSSSQGVEASPNQLCDPIYEHEGNPNRLLILIQGLGSDSASNAANWQHIKQEVLGSYGAYSYFSYQEGTGNYDAHHTGAGLDALVPRLTSMIENCPSRYTTIDLIGHSLGGVLAYEYIKEHGSQFGRVRHVITLDSPVSGSKNLCHLNEICNEINIPDWLIEVFNGQGTSDSAIDLGEMHRDAAENNPNNIRRIKELRRAGIVVYTVTNEDDWVILNDDALTGGGPGTWGFWVDLGNYGPFDDFGHDTFRQTWRDVVDDSSGAPGAGASVAGTSGATSAATVVGCDAVRVAWAVAVERGVAVWRAAVAEGVVASSIGLFAANGSALSVTVVAASDSLSRGGRSAVGVSRALQMVQKAHNGTNPMTNQSPRFFTFVC